jgi:nitrogenase subunit NifH
MIHIILQSSYNHINIQSSYNVINIQSPYNRINIQSAYHHIDWVLLGNPASGTQCAGGGVLTVLAVCWRRQRQGGEARRRLTP